MKALCEWVCLQRTVQSIDLSVFWALFGWCLTGVYKGKLRGPCCLFLCSLLLVTGNSFQAIQPGKMQTGVCQGWEVKAIMCRPGSEIFICTEMVLDNQIVEIGFVTGLVLFGCFPYTTQIRSREGEDTLPRVCLTCCMESLTILLWHLSTCSCHLGNSPCLAPALLSLLWAQGLQPEASGDREQLFPGIKHPNDEVTELPRLW